MEKLTEKQQEFLNYLEKEIEKTAKAPSLRQAAESLGVSHTAIAQLLRTLESKGYIVRDGHYSRNIFLRNNPTHGLDLGKKIITEVPIIGTIAVGLPLYAQQIWDGTVVVDRRLFPGNNLFALRIQGDSMVDVGIFEKDLVICEPRQFAQDGEIVVALLVKNEEATVKRFYLRKDCVELHSENRKKKYKIQKHLFSDVLIQGKVLGVIRSDTYTF